MGYLWACDETNASYDAMAVCDYVYKSSGGAVTVVRAAVGHYVVTFAGLGGFPKFGGNVQVTAYGILPALCPSDGWSNGIDLTLVVRCLILSGAALGSRFDALYVW
ncbi:MAG: hypothetical protein ACE5GC_09480 [Acidimicrobiia bacterium]